MPRLFDPVILETPRLVLRCLEAGDADDLFAMCAVPEVMRYTPRAPMTQRAEAEQMLERIAAGQAQGTTFQLGMVRKQDAMLIGDCVLFSFHESSRRAELGYKMNRACWGQGYMDEALRAFIGHAFHGLGLHRLEADIDPRNIASARSLERLGFRHEGHLRERWIVDGEISDTDLYGLLAREWRG